MGDSLKRGYACAGPIKRGSECFDGGNSNPESSETSRSAGNCKQLYVPQFGTARGQCSIDVAEQSVRVGNAWLPYVVSKKGGSARNTHAASHRCGFDAQNQRRLAHLKNPPRKLASRGTQSLLNTSPRVDETPYTIFHLQTRGEGTPCSLIYLALERRGNLKRNCAIRVPQFPS